MGQVTGRMEHILFEIIHCTWRYITDGIGLVLYNIAGEGDYIAMIVTWPITGSSLTARLNVSAPQPAGSTLFHRPPRKATRKAQRRYVKFSKVN